MPFTERFFDLALPSDEGTGYVGMITANSFMKREFGKTLIEKYLPRWDLTHVVDTTAAQIPHHNSTVILFARNRPPVGDAVRAVMFIKGDAGSYDDPAQGSGWREIVNLIDRGVIAGQFVSVSDVERARLAKHPWSIGGGGAAELKEMLDQAGQKTLEPNITEIGRTTHTGEDEVFYLSEHAARTYGLTEWTVPLGVLLERSQRREPESMLC